VKIKISEEHCTGHGRCMVVAPAVYKLDDNGYNADRGKTIPVAKALEAAARLGAAKCPERAITIIEE